MEEPLLGVRRKSSLYFDPSLFYIPEDEPANLSVTPVACGGSSSLKERLIFGSPEVSPRSPYIVINSARHSADSRLLESPEFSCKKFLCRSLTSSGRNEVSETYRMGGEKRPLCDDSVIDYGSYWRNPHLYKDQHVPERSTFWPGSPEDLYLDTGNIQQGKTEACPVPQEQYSVVNLPEDVFPEVKSKRYLHRSRTAPAMAVMDGGARRDSKLAPKEAPTSVVKQAFFGLILYLLVGICIFVWRQDDFSGISTDGFVDALYFCIVTLCTIGYGDITPCTPAAKIFSCLFVLVGFGFIDILLSGMVTYVLDRQESFLLGTVAGGHHEIASHYVIDVKKGRMRIRMKVALAFGVVILSLSVGTIVMHFIENLAWLDAFYLSCMSVTTVGYGDHAFKTLQGRLFASIWLLVSTIAVARAFLYLAEARIEKRHRLIAKRILQTEMTVGDLVAADLDNDNCVSKSDFVVYKLKQMGRIEEKDIMEVCRQFNKLDTDNTGKITLSCLINHHEESLSANT